MESFGAILVDSPRTLCSKSQWRFKHISSATILILKGSRNYVLRFYKRCPRTHLQPASRFDIGALARNISSTVSAPMARTMAARRSTPDLQTKLAEIVGKRLRRKAWVTFWL